MQTHPLWCRVIAFGQGQGSDTIPPVTRNALLLQWYRRHRRPLPWRESPDAYRVWLSEVMLQQTQVTAVVPYFERFVAAFPDVHALARASEEDVLAGENPISASAAMHRTSAFVF